MKKKILIFSPGTIGDIITAMPAIQRIRSFHNDSEIHFYNSRFVKNDIHRTLFDNLDLFDKSFFQQVPEKLFQNPWERIRNWHLLFREHYDILYELPCNTLTPKSMLKAFGTKKIAALDKLDPNGVPRYRFLLNFLADCGIPRIENDECINWNFQAEEIEAAENWFRKIQIPAGYSPIIVCTGGKSPLQHWPLDRYAMVLGEIIPKYRLFPIFVGAPSDESDATYLMRACKSGVFSQTVGPISLRELILVFKKNKLYIGNDTGILHLAGASGIPCFVISSARAAANYWAPIGKKSQIITADVPCKNCKKNSCPYTPEIPCMKEIHCDDVLRRIAFFEKDILH